MSTFKCFIKALAGYENYIHNEKARKTTDKSGIEVLVSTICAAKYLDRYLL